MSTAQQFGRYRLVERIATGGMGEVFLARYLTAAGIERLAVVKRILPSLSKTPKFVTYFLNEGRVTSLLCHPNVVQTIELGRTAGQYYIAMEYIPGPTLVRILAEAMRRGQDLSIRMVTHLAAQIASALEYIHNLTNIEGEPLRIVHMDLAPHNILVAPDGRLKLLDFGISRAAGLSREHARNEFRGRTAYLAPEQLDGLVLDHRVDLFALGIIMHEMLLARPLFRARVDQQTATRILYAPIPRPTMYRKDCPEQLERIVLRALTRDRDKRYRNASEIIEDLETFSASQGLVPSKAALRDELRQLGAWAPSEADADSAAQQTSTFFEASASTTLD